LRPKTRARWDHHSSRSAPATNRSLVLAKVASGKASAAEMS
jgi:hypothetical protein